VNVPLPERILTRRGPSARLAEAPGVATLFDAHALPAEATLYADGGARGNPGPAASGAVLVDPGGSVITEIGSYLGTATNNVAEWTALCIGLEAALEHGIKRLAVRLDSELVVKQMNGEYRVKHAGLQPLYRRARHLQRQFERIEFAHVRREKNKLADSLVNRVLDAQTAAQDGEG
jgi:ribonuclease HI